MVMMAEVSNVRAFTFGGAYNFLFDWANFLQPWTFEKGEWRLLQVEPSPLRLENWSLIMHGGERRLISWWIPFISSNWTRIQAKSN